MDPTVLTKQAISITGFYVNWRNLCPSTGDNRHQGEDRALYCSKLREAFCPHSWFSLYQFVTKNRSPITKCQKKGRFIIGLRIASNLGCKILSPIVNAPRGFKYVEAASGESLMITCPECGGSTRRSVRATLREFLFSIVYVYPFRCIECGHRFRRLQWGIRYVRYS